MVGVFERLLAVIGGKDRNRKFLPFFWNLTASVANQGTTVVTNVLIVHLSTVQIFGQYAAVQAAVMALSSITQLSAWFAATKFSAELIDRDAKRLGDVLGVLSAVAILGGAAGSIGLLITSNWYAVAALHDAHLATGVMLASGFVLCTAINSFQAGALLGSGAIGSYAKSSLALIPVVILLPPIGLVALGANGALAGLSLGALVRCAITEWILRRELYLRNVRIRYAHFRANLSTVWHFCLPASANGLTYAGAMWIVSILIVHSAGGFRDMAIFSAVVTLKTLILFLPSQINIVVIALINRASKSQSDQYRNIFWMNLYVIVGFTSAVAVIMALIAAPVLRIYSQAFVEGSTLLKIYMIGAIPEALGFALMQHFSAGQRLWKPLILGAIPRDLSFVILSYILLPKTGVNGVGVAYAISWTVCSIGYSALIWLDTRSAKPAKS